MHEIIAKPKSKSILHFIHKENGRKRGEREESPKTRSTTHRRKRESEERRKKGSWATAGRAPPSVMLALVNDEHQHGSPCCASACGVTTCQPHWCDQRGYICLIFFGAIIIRILITKGLNFFKKNPKMMDAHFEQNYYRM